MHEPGCTMEDLTAISKAYKLVTAGHQALNSSFLAKPTVPVLLITNSKENEPS